MTPHLVCNSVGSAGVGTAYFGLTLPNTTERSSIRCTPLEGLHLKRLRHAHKTQQHTVTILPQVSDVYLEAGFLYNSVDVMYLTDSCQLHFGRMDLTDIASLTSNKQTHPLKGQQNPHTAVVRTVIPGKLLIHTPACISGFQTDPTKHKRLFGFPKYPQQLCCPPRIH
jgi:hypothetical protein